MDSSPGGPESHDSSLELQDDTDGDRAAVAVDLELAHRYQVADTAVQQLLNDANVRCDVRAAVTDRVND